MKKIYCTLLCLLCVITSWAQGSLSGTGSGTENDPYRIYNVYQLAELSNFTNRAGVVIELKNDIDLSGFLQDNNPSEGWEPVGTLSQPFKGILKGKNHKITGFYVNRGSSSYVGFFGALDGATISDLTIEGTYVKGIDYIGGFAGKISDSRIDNCTITLSNSTGVSGTNRVGGFAGHITNSFIGDCNVTANVTATGDYVGCLAGYVSSSSSTRLNIQSISTKGKIIGNSRVGGLVGYLENYAVKYVTVQGDVSGKTSTGGMAGRAKESTFSDSSITGQVNGTSWVGGISGFAYGNCSFNKLKSEGDVSGTSCVSGGVGWIDTTAVVSFTDVHTRGSITNTGDNSGGIVGKCFAGSISNMTNCSHFGNIKGSDYVGGLVGFINGKELPHIRTIYGSDDWQTNNYAKGPFYDVIKRSTGFKQSNFKGCTVIGEIQGSNYVGGLIGRCKGISSYSYTSEAKYYTSNYDEYYTWVDGKCLVDTINGRRVFHKYVYYEKRTYETKQAIVDLSDNYYSGAIAASKYVGGIIGYNEDGNITHCYSNSTIIGSSEVGGIVGFLECTHENYSQSDSNKTAKLFSNVANISSIKVEQSSVGRIYGSIVGDVQIGELGTNSSNRALVSCQVFMGGVEQSMTSNKQNGNTIGSAMLKLKANYVSWGWDFTNTWNILETESFPYMKYQAAPPHIDAGLTPGSTTITGNSINGGTVTLNYKDYTPQTFTCGSDHRFTFNTQPLEAGEQVRLFADVEGMVPSYISVQTIRLQGAGTEVDPYLIYTASDLQSMPGAGYFKIMQDIDLSSWIATNSPTKGWVPVGGHTEEGTYIDGNNCTISGLWMNTDAKSSGLFAEFSSGYIKNLTVSVANGKSVKSTGSNVGVLIGKLSNGSIEGCSVSGNVNGNVNIGGIVGNLTNGSIEGCSMSGNLNGIGSIGGIVGFGASIELIDNIAECIIAPSGTTLTANCGGIIGRSNGSGIIKNNEVSVSIECKHKNYYVGGIVGYASSTTIENCSASATINTTTDKPVGGIAGYALNCNSAYSRYISGCYSEGTITNTSFDNRTGGIVGSISSSDLLDCYSSAIVTGTQYTAGVVGHCQKGTVNRCYSSGDIYGGRWAAGVVGYLTGEGASVTNSAAMNNILSVTDAYAWASRIIGGYTNDAGEPNSSNYALKTMQVSINGIPTAKVDDPVEGVAKTESELKSSALYSSLGWDMSETWSIAEGLSYPRLKWLSDTSAVTSITLNKSEAAMIVGQTFTLSATVDPVSEQGNITWSSSNPAVATVANGVVSAVGAGSATIKVISTKDSSISASCLVTVSADTPEPGGDDEPQPSGADTDISQFDNVVYIDRIESKKGETATLVVNMNNVDDVYGYQFELYLPMGVTVATEVDKWGDETILAVQETERTDNSRHAFGVSFVDGHLQVLCHSSAKKKFLGNSGQVAAITIKVADDLEAGDYPIIIRNEVISLNDSPERIDSIKTTLSVIDYKLGDANCDSFVDVGDITTIAGYILGSADESFAFGAADANQDSYVDVGDITTIAGWILDGTANHAPALQKESVMEAAFTDSQVSVEAGQSFILPVCVDNSDDAFSSFQFDVILPEDITIEGIERNDARIKSADFFMASEMEDGNLRVLSYTIGRNTVADNTGAIVYLKLHASKELEKAIYPVMLVSGVFSRGAQSLAVQDALLCVNVENTTGINNLSDADCPLFVYDVNGRLVGTDLNKLPEGIYVVNGKKIVK